MRPIKYSKFPKLNGLEIDGFSRQLNYFKKNFKIITQSDIIDHIYKNKELQYTLNINDLYEEKLIISYILPNTLISVLNNFNHGDIIEEVNDKKVKNLNDLRIILKKEYKINGLKCIKIKNSNNEIVILDYKKTNH